jgi:hypothetical protein
VAGDGRVPHVTAELRALVEGYASAADARDGDAFGALFLPGAWLETRPAGQRYDGAAAIAGIPEKLGVYASTDHRVGGSRFDVADDRASGTTACEAHHVRDGVDKVMTITYHDTFGRDAEARWRFASRIVDIERIEEVPS